jgi:2'-5' RNA ligase
MGETTRTFFAIEVPEPIGLDLVRVQEALAPDLPGYRFTRSTPFHLTLAFVGDVQNDDLNQLHAVVAESVSRFEPVELRFDGLGAFPSPRRPRVIWAGLAARNPELLNDLRQALTAAVTKFGYPCEDARFHPHVTLGRFKPGGRGPCELTAIVERYRSWSCGSFTASEVVGFASRQGGAGPRYDALSRARFLGEKSGSPP